MSENQIVVKNTQENLTPKQIADKLGIFQSNYSTYEKDRVPSKERLKQIAQICGVPMDYFKGGNN